MNVDLTRISGLLSATHARVDLDRYQRNIKILKDVAGEGRAFMAVIKANAYGHGSVVCGQAASAAGVDYLAVARVNEGLRLREAGINTPILILGGPPAGLVEEAVKHRLTLSVGTIDSMEAVQSAASHAEHRPRVHLKLDSGLHRYGADPDLAMELARALANDERIDLEGIYAHFSSADEADPAPTMVQIARAEWVVNALNDNGITFKYVHLPNSAATIRGRMGPSNLVRAGIATYGLPPSSDVSLPDGVRPVMTLHSKVMRAFRLSPGEGVSYGLTYQANQPEWAATVPVGYADGLPRSLSNRGWFVIDGQRCPIRGRVCMDQTVVGIPGPVDEGADVLVIGDGGNDAMSANTIAGIHGTINYEIVAGIAARVPRVYYRGGEPIALEDQILGEVEGI